MKLFDISKKNLISNIIADKIIDNKKKENITANK